MLRSTSPRGVAPPVSDDCAPIASTLAGLMEKIISTLVDLKLLDKPIHFKYIIVLHSHGEAAMAAALEARIGGPPA